MSHLVDHARRVAQSHLEASRPALSRHVTAVAALAEHLNVGPCMIPIRPPTRKTAESRSSGHRLLFVVAQTHSDRNEHKPITLRRRVYNCENSTSARVDVVAGRPSKGDPGAHMVKLHQDITQRLARSARKAGASSASQYTADVLALYVGLPEGVVELNRTTIGSTSNSRIKKSLHTSLMVRPQRAVSERLIRLAVESGFPAPHVSPHIVGVLAVHVGLPEHARTPSKEVVPLAI